MLKLNDFFNLANFSHKELFEEVEYPWQAIGRLEKYVKKNLKPKILGKVLEGAYVGDNVFLGKNSVVQHGAWIMGPAIIGENCEIRHGAFVGANVVAGDNVVIGHASEVGNSIFLNNSRAPHFAFVGQSILGKRVNLGAGTKISNLKIAEDEIVIKIGDKLYPTGLIRLGAIIGDETQIGCNTVLNPGTLIGKRCLIYPNSLVRGFLKSNTILKLIQTQQFVKRK